MSRKTSIACGLLLLGMVGLFTALPYVEAEPLGSSEVTVTATIPEYAEASLGPDIVVVMNVAGDLATGDTTVTVGANFAYHVSVHWLQGKVWNPGYYTTVGSTVTGPHDLGSVSGTVTVAGLPNLPGLPGPVGTAEGADAYDEASVEYPAGTEVGKVQVTVSHQ